MGIHAEEFLIHPGRPVRLDSRPTSIGRYYESKPDYKDRLRQSIRELDRLQQLHYACGRCAVLLIFQGMDASGKDSAIRHVMTGINPQGCRIHSFRKPEGTELGHDFLWPACRRLPERGMIGVFNRSYYEEVLVVRVHPELLGNRGIPVPSKGDDSIWEERCHAINTFESLLHANNTRIVKFFLHLSEEEQRKRLIARIDRPEKNWKLSVADIEERRFWRQYMEAYEACLEATSTRQAPWYVVPADDKRNARLIIARIIIDHFESMGMRYPAIDEGRQRQLNAIRELLESRER